jgi:hypothetical protein
MKKIVWMVVLILLVLVVKGMAGVVLGEIVNPSRIYIDGGELFVVDFPRVYIYSLEDFSLRASFGKEGEGPGEMRGFGRLMFDGGEIVVEHHMRFSYFSRDGEFIKERKIPGSFNRGVRKMGNKWVVSHTDQRKDKPDLTDLTVNIYNDKFEREREIYRLPYYFQLNKPINAIYLPEADRRSGIRFFVQGDEIFVEGEEGETGNIYVFDKNGKKLRTLAHKYQRLEVTDAHVAAVVEHNRLKKRRLYDILKQRGQILIPDLFPAVQYMTVANGSIYTIPYKKEGGSYQLLRFDSKGKLIAKKPVLISAETLFSFYPFTIHKEKIFQLLENSEEEWEIRIIAL